jgi:dTDP-4-dehydrorhamnose 3,5-epimerase
VIAPPYFEDHRGFFTEVFREDRFHEAGLPVRVVQANHSSSVRGVLRGLHFQWDPPMGKLMRVSRGEAFLVAVDIRKASPTLGHWFARVVSAESREQVWAPPGFARGFCALSESAEVQYLCTATYNPATESGIRWNDPDIGIDWPVAHPILSKKDGEAQTLSAWLDRPESDHFQY